MADMKGYYPDILKEADEFQRIAICENPELSRLWDCLEDVFADQFIEDATVNALKKWEKALHLLPKGTDTLSQRRKRILLKMNEQLPYTFRRLEQLLTAACGTFRHKTILEPGQYKLTVKTDPMPRQAFEDIWDMLERIVPVNLIIRLLQEYKTEGNKVYLGAYSRMVNTVKVYPHMVHDYTEEAALQLMAAVKYSGNIKVEIGDS